MKMLLVPATFLLVATIALGTEPIFTPVKIDGPKHDPANHTYWYGPFSECCSVADYDGDGDLDIAAGRNWYEAPDWTVHADFRDGARINGPETENNSEFAMDVNFDGRPDVVTSGWMRDKGAFWHENPGRKGIKWKAHRIHTARSMEGVDHGDLDGDGDDDILCNHWSLQPGQGMTWLEHIDREPWFVEHVIGTEGEGHGNGLGDVNMDGRTDIVTPSGWWESPPRPATDDWTFHADYQFRTAASHPILVHDVNRDGLNDIIIGAAHTYGLAWLEQHRDREGQLDFKEHWVESVYGQFHTMAMGDLDGDGRADLVTGKRLFAHHGRDDSCYEPLFAFWYDMKGGTLNRHILSFCHLPRLEDDLTRRNPPPTFVPAVGMKIHVADMDADGHQDIVICGKGGLYIFYRRGQGPQPRPRHRLPVEEAYPTWEEWTGMPLPPAPELPRRIHGAGPSPARLSDNRPARVAAASDAIERVDMPTVPELERQGFTSLFNGRDLSGWRVPEGDNGHWKVEDGVIDYDALSEARGNKSLFTSAEFEDYTLYFEWRFKQHSGLYAMPTILPDGSLETGADGRPILTPTPNSDSGLLLRGGGHQANLWCWPCGSGELWSVRNNEDLTPEQRAAAVPKARADGAVGEWNRMMATVKGDRVTIVLNGLEVISDARIPGISPRGPIGFQHHGGRLSARQIQATRDRGAEVPDDAMSPASSLVQFRSVFVKRLSRAAPDSGDGWITLFDGRDLDQWRMGPDRSWVVEDGVIALKREFDGNEHNLDYLWTREQYGDFVLDLEYKVPERANSGVFLRTADRGDPVYTGIEVQVANSYGREGLSRGGTAGAIYDCSAPTANAAGKPGEWNHYVITCKGAMITVVLNGETVNEMNLDLWTTPNRNPDGSENKFPVALKEFARRGYVGLQDHGRPIWYRNVRIKPLGGSR